MASASEQADSGKADDGAVGVGHDASGVVRIVEQARGLAVELGVEFAGEGFGVRLRGC